MSSLSPQVELLRRQYLQLLDPSSLTIPAPNVLKQPEIQFQIFNSMFREESLPYPPPERYRARVLKILVTALEAAMVDPDEDEISDDLISSLAASMSCRPSASESPTEEAQRRVHVTYIAPTPLFLPTPSCTGATPECPPSPSSSTAPERTITILESPSLLSAASTTGFRTWEASKYLTSFLYSSPIARKRYIEDKNIIELGAGTGLLSLASLMWMDAAYVLATDGSDGVAKGLRGAALLNCLECELENGGEEEGKRRFGVAVLSWGDQLNRGVLGERKFDKVIGADVTFSPDLISPLLSTLSELFSRHGNPEIEALIAATIRNEDTIETFLKECRSQGFRVEVITSSRDNQQKGKQGQQLGLFHETHTEIRVYRLWRGREKSE